MRRAILVIVAAVFVCMAQTKTPPPPSGTLISKEICGNGIDDNGNGLIDENCSTTGTGSKGGSTLPPPETIQSTELTEDVRGNEGTEYLKAYLDAGNTAGIAKAMPNAVINGLPRLVLNAAPTMNLVTRAANMEHLMASHEQPNGYNYFTPRLAHMPPERLDDRTVRLCELDTYWGAHICRTFVAVDDHNVDFTDEIWFESAAPFLPEGAATLMSADYMPFTTDPAQYIWGIPSAGAPEQWIRWIPPFPGGSVLGLGGVPLVVDPAPAGSFGYAATYKDNLKSFDYPQYTRPGYCGFQSATHTTFQVMFDLGVDLSHSIALTMFDWKMKIDSTTGQWQGDPAWDWEHRIDPVVAGQVYTYHGRISVRPTGADPLGECAAEDAAWRAR